MQGKYVNVKCTPSPQTRKTGWTMKGHQIRVAVKASADL